MKILFAVLGALLGGLLTGGGFFGALAGLVVGISIAVVISHKSGEGSASPTAQVRPSGTAEGARSEAPPGLVTRVARLEQEVARLRDEVSRLQAGAPTTAATAGFSEAAAPPSLPQDVLIVPAFDLPASKADAGADAAAIDAALPAELVALPTEGPALPAAVPSMDATLHFDLPEPAPSDAAATPFTEAAAPSSEPLLPVPPAVSPPTPPAADAPTVQPRPVRPAVAATEPVALQDHLPDFLKRWIFGGNTIVKVGVLILFLGLAFLLRYAAERVTVPVEWRYAGVALLGVALLALGWRLRHRADAAGGTGYGLILQGAGVGVFYLTTLAAMKLHGLLPVELAFALLALVAVLGAVLAVLQNAPWLALVSVLEGFAAPVLVSTGTGNHHALFSYLAVLDIGIFLMAWFKAWRPLNLVGFVGTFTLAGFWADRYYTAAFYPETQFFLLLFFVLFTAIGVLFARRALAIEPDAAGPDDSFAARASSAFDQVGRVDSTLVFGLPLAAFGLQYLLVDDTAWGAAWASAGFALFYLLLGGALLRGGHRRYVLLGEAFVVVAAIFGTLTVPLALEGEWTGATWAIEAAGMYWLGMRQRRTYARAFALVVMGGAVVRLVTSLGLDLAQPHTPLITGSVIGMALLGASALALFAVHRRADPPESPVWEKGGALAALWLGVSALPTLAWMLLSPLWASVATAVMATAMVACGGRLALPALHWLAAVCHAVALAGLAATLHRIEGEAMLRNGGSGLVAAVVIGACLLLTGWIVMAPQRRQLAARPDTVPVWSLASSVGLLAGLAVMGLALLYVMPADSAALAWPWMGLGALWLGLRLAHPALVLGWWWLQMAAGLAFLAYGPPLWDPMPEGSLTLWTPLVLTLTGLLAGDAWQRAARSERYRRVAWIQGVWVQWAIVAWGLAWWSQALLPDLERTLVRLDLQTLWLSALVAWVLLSALGMALLARWRGWTVLGQATAVTVPAWVALAWVILELLGLPAFSYGGWLVWPAALLGHGLLLRMQERWLKADLLKLLHVAGFWLFLLLAARQMLVWAGGWGEPGSAWQTLGWVLVPAAVLWLIGRPAVLARWPLTTCRDTYLVWACAPVALCLVGWLWLANLQSGLAAPLPYLPLLNPLELGQGLVMGVLVFWYRVLPEGLRSAVPRQAWLAGLGATAFAAATAIVLRTCHHWAGVAWQGQALYASTLTQASLSVAWSVIGVALMLLGHRRAQRAVWVVGAGLLGGVVVKLFFIELADHGGLYRIVSFIVVGLLLLVVGYFAPVPPSRPDAAEAAPRGAQ